MLLILFFFSLKKLPSERRSLSKEEAPMLDDSRDCVKLQKKKEPQ